MICFEATCITVDKNRHDWPSQLALKLVFLYKNASFAWLVFLCFFVAV
uniref:Uncharacterized protein n=1 Tax=Arundo donax TaxID=35708 RepID=A0A0A9ADA1_ARUDO